jgi:glycosyltransferase involved in cell wall biosynthesis
MRVLHIGKYFPPVRGGMETFLKDLCCALGRRDVSVAVLAHRPAQMRDAPDAACDDGTKLDVCLSDVLCNLAFTPISPGFPRRLHRLLRDFRPDLLHLHLPNPSVFWALLLPAARALPWVLHWHADVGPSRSDWRVRLAYPWYRPLEQAMLRRAKRVIATSAAYRDASTALGPWLKKVQVIPLGLDPARLRPPEVGNPAVVWPSQGRLRVLAIGRLTYYKGFDHLIGAAAETEQVSVRIVGGGEKAGALADLIRNLGVAGRVELLGELDSAALAAQLHACDCLCLPSIDRAEAFGVVLLEAMAAGKALVISDLPGSGMGGLIEQSRSGLKTPPGDAQALAAAFDQLAAAPARCAAMGVEGRRRFDTLYHIDPVAGQVADLYRAVIGPLDEGCASP